MCLYFSVKLHMTPDVAANSLASANGGEATVEQQKGSFVCVSDHFGGNIKEPLEETSKISEEPGSDEFDFPFFGIQRREFQRSCCVTFPHVKATVGDSLANPVSTRTGVSGPLLDWLDRLRGSR